MPAAPPVIVGFDGTPSAQDALRLGLQLAAAGGAPVVAAFVYRIDVLDLGDSTDYHAALRTVAERELQEARTMAPDAELVAVGARNAPRGLHELAEERGASAIVVGGTHRGPLGRIVPGSTAQRLLEGAPCPVAVAPRGHAEVERFDLVVCGYDADADGAAAVERAGALAKAFGVPLRIVTVIDAPDPFPAVPTTLLAADLAEQAEREVAEHAAVRRRGALDAVAAGVPDGVSVEPLLLHGDPADQLVDRSPERTGLLVVGSRGYGPMGAVLMGSVAAEVLRRAKCPVVVVPRST